jgi:hypothetical protein
MLRTFLVVMFVNKPYLYDTDKLAWCSAVLNGLQFTVYSLQFTVEF